MMIERTRNDRVETVYLTIVSKKNKTKYKIDIIK